MMFSNYFKIAIRHLKRHKLITAINIFGLAVGMACCIFIVLYVKNELSYDNFHVNASNIYRVTTKTAGSSAQVDYGGATQFPVGSAIKNEVKGIKDVTRFFWPGSTQIQVGNKKLKDNVAAVDPGFFSMFSFPFVEGDAATALKDPYTVVLSETAARKYFGDQPAIGKSINIANSYDCLVTGIMKDMPENTDLRTDIVVSFATIKAEAAKEGANLDNLWFLFQNNTTYVQLKDNVDPASLNNDFKALVDLHIKPITDRLGLKFALQLQSMKNVHLYPSGDKGNVNKASSIWIYLAIAAFIVLIACFNFINLTTARASERAKEVGLRKVLGAERKSLVFQFLTESSLVSVLSLLIAIILVLALLPSFNAIVNKNISLLSRPDTLLYLGAIFLAAFVGLAAGSYPALYLSSLLPIKVLKGNFNTSGAGNFVRKTLVVFQFAMAVGMIICAGVVYSQLKFWQERNLGFDKEHLVNIPMFRAQPGKTGIFKAAVLGQSDVSEGTLNNMLLGQGIFSNNPVAKEGDDDKESFGAGVIQADFDLVKTLKLKIVAGRNFDPRMATDSTAAFIVNEAAAKRFGFTNQQAIGQRIEWRPGGEPFHGTIVGVVANFNVHSLKEIVEPVLYIVKPEGANILTVRLSPGDHKAQLKHIEQLWNTINPDLLFEYSFVDQDIQDEYKTEHTLGKLFGIFSGLTIVIASIGLLGLSILTARQRTREIGIRKVLGANVANISVLLTKDFLKLVLIGGVCALPLAYYGMSKWLQNFAFSISVQWWVMGAAIMLVVLIAVITISSQAISAAMANPVKSLKSE